MRAWVDPHDGARSVGIIAVFIGRKNAEAEGQACAAEFFHPNPYPYVADTDDGLQILNGVCPDKMKLVGVFLGIEDAAPTKVFPERTDGAFEEEQVASVVEDLKSIEVVEIDAHMRFVKAGHGARA